MNIDKLNEDIEKGASGAEIILNETISKCQ